ncbi:MAG: glycoside hydrolase N-terminal domain-containing protein [Fimbriimonadaceae bacterium]|nr:glycoside hydrolase N-terminal domain-containing protein [Fimbriimonadaceae bacterium]
MTWSLWLAAACLAGEPEGYALTASSAVYESSDPLLALSSEVTLEAWVRAGKLPAAGARILDRHAPGTDDGYLLDTYPGDSLRLICANGAVGHPARLTGEAWHHVVAVYSSPARRQELYLDGRLVASRRDGAFPPIRDVNQPLRVGANPTGGDRFNGQIRRAAVYRQALSAAAVAARAAGGAAPDGVLGEWVFEPQARAVLRPVAGTVVLSSSGDAVELSGSAPAPEAPLTLWYRQPARQWVEALALGNGRLGAMVFGGVSRERLQLNEDTFWAAGPYNPAVPGALPVWREAQQLALAGKLKEAEALCRDKLLGNPGRQVPYQPVGDLLLTLPGGDQASDYRRSLDLDTATALTEFERDGVRQSREAFSSPTDQVIVVHLRADRPGQVHFSASLRSPQEHRTEVLGGDLQLTAQAPPWHGIAGALRAVTRLRVLTRGGQQAVEGATLTVRGADEATLLLAIATNYRRYDDVSGQPEATVAAQLEAAAARGYSALRARHCAEHQRLFRRVSFDLGATPGRALPTDERLQAAAAGAADADLAALYFQFGRYLLASCSRPDDQPANLQGLWNESRNPPWDSKFTININTEMNYWPAESANLAECVEPLARMLGELRETGAVTARTMFGARGWVCFHNTDHWRATAPIDGPWAYTPTCGAWLATALWERYLFSGERADLQAAYPLLRDAALFFLDTLVPEPSHGWLVTAPSASPENRHYQGTPICVGPTMDNQILRDLFSYCETASAALGVDADLRAQWAATRAKLPPNQIGREGQLQEWLDDWDTQPGADRHHRHVSHLYGLFPSAQIDARRTPELAAAARRSLELRGDAATGWSLGWKLNLWARLRDGERAQKLLAMLLHPSRTYPNLFDAHPPFQIDGNFGGVSGMVEMLLQSHAGELDLLPALPPAWPRGSVRGLRARGGFEVDLAWEAGRLTSAAVRSARGGTARLRWAERTADLAVPAGGEAVWRP